MSKLLLDGAYALDLAISTAIWARSSVRGQAKEAVIRRVPRPSFPLSDGCGYITGQNSRAYGGLTGSIRLSVSSTSLSGVP